MESAVISLLREAGVSVQWVKSKMIHVSFSVIQSTNQMVKNVLSSKINATNCDSWPVICMRLQSFLHIKVLELAQIRVSVQGVIIVEVINFWYYVSEQLPLKKGYCYSHQEGCYLDFLHQHFLMYYWSM